MSYAERRIYLPLIFLTKIRRVSTGSSNNTF